MPDIDCAKCAEPWDAWGIMNDMPKSEAVLFRKGAGCPSCKGVTPEGWDAAAIAEEHVRQRTVDGVFDDDCPGEFLQVLDGPPPWKDAEG